MFKLQHVSRNVALKLKSPKPPDQVQTEIENSLDHESPGRVVSVKIWLHRPVYTSRVSLLPHFTLSEMSTVLHEVLDVGGHGYSAVKLINMQVYDEILTFSKIQNCHKPQV